MNGLVGDFVGVGSILSSYVNFFVGFLMLVSWISLSVVGVL